MYVLYMLEGSVCTAEVVLWGSCYLSTYKGWYHIYFLVNFYTVLCNYFPNVFFFLSTYVVVCLLFPLIVSIFFVALLLLLPCHFLVINFYLYFTYLNCLNHWSYRYILVSLPTGSQACMFYACWMNVVCAGVSPWESHYTLACANGE